MSKPKCTECGGSGLVVFGLKNKSSRWCACPAGREFVREINKARAQMGHKPLQEKPRPSGPALH